MLNFFNAPSQCDSNPKTAKYPHRYTVRIDTDLAKLMDSYCRKHYTDVCKLTRLALNAYFKGDNNG